MTAGRLTYLLIAGFCIALAPSACLSEEPLRVATVVGVVGVAGVRDGDGLLFGDVEVRHQGVAAPERRDPRIVPAATAALRNLAEGKELTCHLDGTTATSNRPVGVCYVGEIELGAALVRMGVARDCPAYSGGRYACLEKRAQAQGMDLSERYMLPSYC